MTPKEIAQVFALAPKREFNDVTKQGYFLAELRRMNISKTDLKKLEKNGVVKGHWIRMMGVKHKPGTFMRFYSLNRVRTEWPLNRGHE